MNDSVSNVSINVKILFLIIALVALFQIVISLIPSEDDADVIISVVSFINPLSTAFACFYLVKNSSTPLFRKSFLYFGFGFIAIVLAEITYVIYDLILGLDPYPSIADVFFFALYPFTIIFMLLNIRSVSPHVGNFAKFWMALISVWIVSSFVFVSLQEIGDANFDFYYGLIFISGTAATLSISAYGVKIFQKSPLKKIWLFLMIGIIAGTIGDMWYYYLELFGEYDLFHPVNGFWYASYWILFYAILKFKKSSK